MPRMFNFLSKPPGRAFKRAADPNDGKKAAVMAVVTLTTPVECKAAGYTAAQCFHTLGCAAIGLKTAGYSADECIAAGFEKCPKCNGRGKAALGFFAGLVEAIPNLILFFSLAIGLGAIGLLGFGGLLLGLLFGRLGPASFLGLLLGLLLLILLLGLLLFLLIGGDGLAGCRKCGGDGKLIRAGGVAGNGLRYWN
jgi:hypothetical protein